MLAREGGEAQHYRAEISVLYGRWLSEQENVVMVDVRPYSTVLNRVLDIL